ncbi:ATP-binding cassette domain-containing protein, partial [Staphylococcus condimenti]
MPSKQRLSRIMNLLEDVGLDESYLKRYPKMLSGGEAQRIAIARSISTYPNYIMLDEAISSLDMSIQVQILDLLKYLKEKHQLSYIFITHDIQTAVYLCKKIIVFKEGKIQETLMREVLYQSDNKYVKQLLNKQLMD